MWPLNPIIGVIDGFRWALLRGGATIHWPAFSLSIGLSVLLLWAGVVYFRSTERTFADII